jgi:hypothetical protein
MTGVYIEPTRTWNGGHRDTINAMNEAWDIVSPMAAKQHRFDRLISKAMQLLGGFERKVNSRKKTISTKSSEVPRVQMDPSSEADTAN